MALGGSPFGVKDCLISPELSLQPLQSLEETRQLPSKLLHGNSHRSTWFSPGLRSDPGTELTPDQGSGFSIFSLFCFTEGHFLWGIWVSGEGQEGKQEQLPSHQKQRGNTWSLFLPVPCIPGDVCHHFRASQLTERVCPFDPDCAQGPQPGLAQNCATWSRYLSLEYSSCKNPLELSPSIYTFLSTKKQQATYYRKKTVAEVLQCLDTKALFSQ